MKKIILLLLLALTIIPTGCKLSKKTNAVSVSESFVTPDPADVVMYQVNPRVFAPSNSLQAVLARIDSIEDLGVNMIWIMPIYPIGEEKSKNSPYSVRDYKAVAPEYGTIDDLKMLVESCHERGIGVILDWVANHTAWDNVWVKEHPDWYTHDSVGNIIFPPGTDWTDVADLNYDNKDMREAMIDAMKFWIVEVGIDGFRCDVADGVPADFWKDAIDQLRAAAGERKILMLAEGKNVDNFTVGGFDMNYGWDYKDVLVKVFKGAPASDLIQADKAEYDSLPAGKVKLRFTTNHDHSTEATPCVEFTNDRGAMAAYVASIFPHGGALIYGSQEVGYPEPINFFKYVPVDWTAKPRIYKEYRRLIAMYNDHPALRKGKMTAWPDDDVLIFEKADDTERYLILVNVRNEPKTINLPEEWKKLGESIALEPFEYCIVEY